MQISTIGNCCGARTITHLGGSRNIGDNHDADPGEFKINHQVAVASSGHAATMVIVFVNNSQKKIYEATFEECGYKHISERYNAKSGNRIHCYLWTKPDRKA